MQLRFIGTGAAFFPELGSTSAFFARGGDLFLIDCGESVFARVMRADLLGRYPGKLTVFITHLHADHCGSLASLVLYAADVLRREVTIVYPGEEIRTLLRLMGVQDAQYEHEMAYAREGLTGRAVPSEHVAAISAYSYFLTDERDTIYYSGDSSVLPESILDDLRNGEIAHAYQDVSQYAGALPENPTHLPFQTLCGQVEPPLREKFTLMHFNTDFRAQAKKKGFSCAETDILFS